MQKEISYWRHRFLRRIIFHVFWPYIRFDMSLREVGELMLDLGVDVSCETIRRWTVKPDPLIAAAGLSPLASMGAKQSRLGNPQRTSLDQ